MKLDPVIRQERYIRRERALWWVLDLGLRVAAWIDGEVPGSTCGAQIVRSHMTPGGTITTTFEAWVEEPFPLDFPSETWKQRVMLLA